MKNYNRIFAMTLITTILSSSFGMTNAFADVQVRSQTNMVPVETRVPVTKKRVVEQEYTDYEVRQEERAIKNYDVVRETSDDLTCKAYRGLDHDRLQADYDKLSSEHRERFVKKPLVTTGAAATVGALIAGPLGFVLGGAIGAIGNWFSHGNSTEDRAINIAKNDAQYDEDKAKLNCMENELNRSQTYAVRLPNAMPAGVSDSGMSSQKAQVSRSSDWGPQENDGAPSAFPERSSRTVASNGSWRADYSLSSGSSSGSSSGYRLGGGSYESSESSAPDTNSCK